jgi:hypothetical protein
MQHWVIPRASRTELTQILLPHTSIYGQMHPFTVMIYQFMHLFTVVVYLFLRVIDSVELEQLGTVHVLQVTTTSVPVSFSQVALMI